MCYLGSCTLLGRVLISVYEHVLIAASLQSIPIGAVMSLAFAKRHEHFPGEVVDA
jgi:hypothetical protein